MKSAIWFLDIFYNVGSFPFSINWQNGGNVEPLGRLSLRFLLWALSSCMEWANLVYLFITLGVKAKVYIEEQKHGHLTFHGMWLAIVWVCSTYAFSLTFLQKELIEITNKSLEFTKRIKRLFGQNSFDRQNKIRNFLITVLGFYMTSTSLLLPFIMIYFRNEIWYVTNYVTPNKWKPVTINNLIPLLIAIGSQLWYQITLWGGFAFMTYVHLSYLLIVDTSMKLLRSSHHVPFKKVQNQIHQKLKIYSEVRILNRIYNNAFRSIYWPYSLTIPCLIFIGGTCSMLRDKSGNLFVFGFNFIGVFASFSFLVTSSVLMAAINTESENLHHYFVGQGRNTKFDKVSCAAYKDIGIEVGSFYIVQKKSFFTLMGLLTNATVSALLSLNQISRKV